MSNLHAFLIFNRRFGQGETFIVDALHSKKNLEQACQTGGPRATCGPFACFVQPELLNFMIQQFIIILFFTIISFIIYKSKIIESTKNVKNHI